MSMFITKRKQVVRTKEKNRVGAKLWSRSSTILPCDVFQTFWVHTGRSFVKLRVVPGMVGFKFGEFGLTRVARLKK